MRKFRNEHKEISAKEGNTSFKYKEYPKIYENYSSQMSTGQKSNKMILTENYTESSPNIKNIYSSEFYKIHSAYTPYNYQKNQNSDEYFSSYQKKMLFGNTDLRNEYSPIADARVNIRKKLLEERSIAQPYTNNSYGDLLENFQYYESSNIRNNSEQKFDSITRIIGYSNLIPKHTQRMAYNYSNVDINKNGKYGATDYKRKVEITKKEITNIQQHQKKEFKKPSQIETVKKQEIVKKYEIKKKPEIKKEEVNKYKQYERKKEKEVKKEVKKEETKKEVKIETKKEIKKEVKEPIIIKRKENIKATFSTHSGRYKYTGNIQDDIANARKNYKKNTEEKNMKKVEIVEKSSKSAKKIENKSKINETKTTKSYSTTKKEVPKKEIKKIEVIKKEEKTKKVVNNVKPVENKVNVTSIKKINISENMSNYKRKKDEAKIVQNNPKVNIVKNKNINIKTESYGKIDENIYKRENIDIGKIININEVKKLYEMKRQNNTPKMKTKRINLGDNYKYYERKYMKSPDENYFTIHQRRNERIIYGEQIIESNGIIKIRKFKNKPLIREERYNKQIISNTKFPPYIDNEHYMACNKSYQNNFENKRRDYNDNREYYYEQRNLYY